MVKDESILQEAFVAVVTAGHYPCVGCVFLLYTASRTLHDVDGISPTTHDDRGLFAVLQAISEKPCILLIDGYIRRQNTAITKAYSVDGFEIVYALEPEGDDSEENIAHDADTPTLTIEDAFQIMKALGVRSAHCGGQNTQHRSDSRLVQSKSLHPIWKASDGFKWVTARVATAWAVPGLAFSGAKTVSVSFFVAMRVSESYGDGSWSLFQDQREDGKSKYKDGLGPRDASRLLELIGQSMDSFVNSVEVTGDTFIDSAIRDARTRFGLKVSSSLDARIFTAWYGIYDSYSTLLCLSLFFLFFFTWFLCR